MFEIYDAKVHGLGQIFTAIIQSPYGKIWTCVYLFLSHHDTNFYFFSAIPFLQVIFLS